MTTNRLGFAVRDGIIQEYGVSATDRNGPRLYSWPDAKRGGQVYDFVTNDFNNTVTSATPRQGKFEPNLPPSDWL